MYRCHLQSNFLGHKPMGCCWCPTHILYPLKIVGQTGLAGHFMFYPFPITGPRVALFDAGQGGRFMFYLHLLLLLLLLFLLLPLLLLLYEEKPRPLFNFFLSLPSTAALSTNPLLDNSFSWCQPNNQTIGQI